MRNRMDNDEYVAWQVWHARNEQKRELAMKMAKHARR